MTSYHFAETAQGHLNALSPPTKQDCMTTWWYSEGRVVAKQVGNNAPEFLSTSDENLTIPALNEEYPVFEKKVSEEAFKKAQEDHREKIDAINLQFEDDLADYLDISPNHPKWNAMMNLATNYASSSNKNTIVEAAEELAILLT